LGLKVFPGEFDALVGGSSHKSAILKFGRHAVSIRY
jgi:hypothetical protein